MKKIIPFLIVFLFIFSGLNVVAENINLNVENFLSSNDTKIDIISIQPSEELKIYSTTYKQNTKNDINNKEIKEYDRSIELMNIFETYDYVIITTENFYDSITSSTFIEWKTKIGFNIKIVNITDNEITSQTGQDLPEIGRTVNKLGARIYSIR